MNDSTLSSVPTADNQEIVESLVVTDQLSSDVPLILITPAAPAGINERKKRKRKSPPRHKSILSSKQRKLEDFCFKKLNHKGLSSSLVEDTEYTDANVSTHFIASITSIDSSIDPSRFSPDTMTSTPKRVEDEMADISVDPEMPFEQSVSENFNKISKLIEESIATTKEVKEELNDFKTEMRNTHDQLDKNLNDRIDGLQKDYEEFKAETTAKLSSTNGGQDMQAPLLENAPIIRDLISRMEQMERERRKLNVAIRGLITNAASVDGDVRNLLGGQINLSDEVVSVRLLPVHENKPPTVIAQMKSMKVKNQLLHLKKDPAKFPQLKDIYFDRDLTQKESKIAWKIRQQARAALSLGKKVKRTYNRLTIDNIVYRWNDTAQEMVPEAVTHPATDPMSSGAGNSHTKSPPKN